MNTDTLPRRKLTRDERRGGFTTPEAIFRWILYRAKQKQCSKAEGWKEGAYALYLLVQELGEEEATLKLKGVEYRMESRFKHEGAFWEQQAQ